MNLKSTEQIYSECAMAYVLSKGYDEDELMLDAAKDCIKIGFEKKLSLRQEELPQLLSQKDPPISVPCVVRVIYPYYPDDPYLIARYNHETERWQTCANVLCDGAVSDWSYIDI